MLAKVFLLACLASVALCSTFEYVDLLRHDYDEKPYLRCEVALGNEAQVLKIEICQKTPVGIELLARVDKKGIEINDTLLIEPIVADNGEVLNLDKIRRTDISYEATSSLNEDPNGVSYLSLSWRKEEDILMYSDYFCDVTYLVPHQQFGVKIERSKVVTIGKAGDLKLDLLQIILKGEDNVLSAQGPKQIDIRQEVWPTGDYSLLRPRYGCPKYDLTQWTTGARLHTTESLDPNLNSNSTADRMPLDLFSVEDSVYLANLSYCNHVKPTSTPSPTQPTVDTFPRGSYCINRKEGTCPEGFLDGSIYMDDEDYIDRNEVFGDVPDGDYGVNTKYFYCCRDDQLPQEEMLLPIQEPFYLYRYSGLCQRVKDMEVVNDYIDIDTANLDSIGENEDKQEGFFPDSEVHNIKLQLCYYTKTL